MNIKGRKITLRAMEKDDCKLVVEMFNDPEMESLVVGWSFPLSQFAQEKWLDNHFADQNNFRFIIEEETGEAVGIATITEIDWKNRCATQGIKIAKRENRHRGIGTDALMAIMRYAFEELQLNRLETTWLEENRPSRSMYQKCGWVEEGRQRQKVFKRGKYHDLIFGSILAQEYRMLIQREHYWEKI